MHVTPMYQVSAGVVPSHMSHSALIVAYVRCNAAEEVRSTIEARWCAGVTTTVMGMACAMACDGGTVGARWGQRHGGSRKVGDA